MAPNEVPFKLRSHRGSPCRGADCGDFRWCRGSDGWLGLPTPQPGIVRRHRNQGLHVRHVFLFVFFFISLMWPRGNASSPTPQHTHKHTHTHTHTPNPSTLLAFPLYFNTPLVSPIFLFSLSLSKIVICKGF